MIALPEMRRGRRSSVQQAEYERQLQIFCDQVLELNSRLDFTVSSRGWCYILEEYGLRKGDFDKAQRLINDARKVGLLPLDITAEDDNRATVDATRGLQCDALSAQDYLRDEAETARAVIDSIGSNYTPTAFWDTQDYYVELFVEKIDLKSLFSRECSRFYVPYTNGRGWTDIHSRAAMLERFARHEANGRQCVLLYCGDHDPGGLHISEQLRKNLNDLEQATGHNANNVIIDRFGLNHDFIEDQGLSWVDNLETSSGGNLASPRHKDHSKPYVQDYLAKYGARKVEANALVTRPDAGRQLCRDAITKYIDPQSVTDYHEQMRQAREHIRQFVPEIVREIAEEMLDDE